MEMPGSCVSEEINDAYVTILRGGPVYVSDMVGPLTGVTDFESSVINELCDLEAELVCDSVVMCGDDISVDELKIVSTEELVDKAFQEEFKSGDGSENNSRVSDENKGSAGNGEWSKSTLTKRKRKRNSLKIDVLKWSCIAMVDGLVRVKQKQEEDKSAARLHSFSGSSSIRDILSAPSGIYVSVSSLKSTSYSSKVRVSNSNKPAQIVYLEIVLCIEVYHGRLTCSKSQELLVLGRQTLDELRDKICCSTDEIMKKAGQDDRSGYFLIEDVFYNELREPSAMDYSKPILDWLRDSEKNALEKWECIISGELQAKQKTLLGSGNVPSLPKFKAFHMHKIRFCDLRFRLGAGYIYCHQGDCKHSIVIRDRRLINAEDLQNQTAYPIVTFQLKLVLLKCCVCKIFGAEKVTVDDKWAPENPYYFCGLCYYMFHYENGSLHTMIFQCMNTFTNNW